MLERLSIIFCFDYGALCAFSELETRRNGIKEGLQKWVVFMPEIPCNRNGKVFLCTKIRTDYGELGNSITISTNKWRLQFAYNLPVSAFGGYR